MSRAQGLRKRETYAENLLWRELRGRKVAGLKFRRQHEIAPYVADFFCEDLKLVIEVDSGVHSDDDRATQDHLRQLDIEALGYCVLRFTNEDVTARLSDVLEAIRAQARLAGRETPHPPAGFADGPLPLPMGEG